MHTDPAPLIARRSGPLQGRVRVPGDKSISHRALILGALTVGETRISGLLEGEDVLNTGKAVRALGATVERTGPGAWRLHGVGVAGFAEPAAPLDFGNSGTGCRLMLGARAHPLPKSAGPRRLRLAGAGEPIPIVYEPPVASAQLKSAVLLAGLAAPGETVVIEAEATRDHTEKMLTHFGADVGVTPHGAHGRRITLVGQPELTPRPIVVPADPSSAAFPLVAAAITPGSDVILEGVMLNPLRAGLIDTLAEMGAAIERLNARIEGGEDVAVVRV